MRDEALQEGGCYWLYAIQVNVGVKFPLDIAEIIPETALNPCAMRKAGAGFHKNGVSPRNAAAYGIKYSKPTPARRQKIAPPVRGRSLDKQQGSSKNKKACFRFVARNQEDVLC